MDIPDDGDFLHSNNNAIMIAMTSTHCVDSKVDIQLIKASLLRCDKEAEHMLLPLPHPHSMESNNCLTVTLVPSGKLNDPPPNLEKQDHLKNTLV